ncbi:polyprenyl synthetase family protein [Lutispora saccharofermentans]|uniref:Polyprenyl synthetase family protein n=1 Tax=Lutispora saccharofermentans TaxID=3024236 RepID=A0ABT1NI44_9FIRM|nr:farnesyl diphosphate synthase [Lutispora saccharofermentans]MCQ1529833.1 polyprenyl synthetase family protein [Lutispora saccharofermentans]
MNISQFIERYSGVIEKHLNSLYPADSSLPIIEEAMKYSLLGGGKRLRPLLAIMSCQLFDGPIDEVVPYACCIELIHTYSLIHDDLPSMDNDDYRRGKLSNHKVYGEGFALLAGDGLLNNAYEILLDCVISNPTESRIRAASVISKAAGISGMIGGQAIDLYYEDKKIDIDKLNEMHSKKTGALIKASLEVGAVISQAAEEDIERIRLYGESLGRAYQISDDILDVVGTKEKMGKTIGKDAKENKATYVTYYGLEKSEKLLTETIDDAKQALRAYGSKAKLLMEFADFIACRDA